MVPVNRCKIPPKLVPFSLPHPENLIIHGKVSLKSKLLIIHAVNSCIVIKYLIAIFLLKMYGIIKKNFELEC